MLSTALFDYNLPEELIAKYPATRRDSSRMMVLDRQTGEYQIHPFSAIADYLHPGDAMIYNDTRVLRGRMYAHKNARPDGAKFELLFIEPLDSERREWLVMVRPGKRALIGVTGAFTDATGAINPENDGFEVTGRRDDGTVEVRLCGAPFPDLEQRYGRMPLPPYIDRDPEAGDLERYQTVYAEKSGAVAAPTAGLHFTPELLTHLAARGVRRAALTLHVGPGTFKPVAAEFAEEHRMHSERYTLSAETADLVNFTHTAGARVLAVGTTTVRVLESCVNSDGLLVPGSGRTEIFLHPPMGIRSVDMLLTNFHLPKSTLLMLVSCFCDREKVLAAYAAAIENKMRFYSYGDCMLLV